MICNNTKCKCNLNNTCIPTDNSYLWCERMVYTIADCVTMYNDKECKK